GDHLRLDLRRTLEDAENARVAQYPADRVFQGETVAPVNLQGVVGRGPRYAGGEKLGHARLEVAAPPAVLFPRSVIGELARDRDLDGGDGKLAVDTGKGDQGLAELLALLGIAEAEFERVLGDADGARRG